MHTSFFTIGRRLAVLLVLLGAVTGPACGAAQDTGYSSQQPELLKLFRASRAPYRSMGVQFEQHKRLAVLDITLQSQGMILFQRPECVRYEILAPMQSLLLFDGKKIRNYTFAEGRWALLNSPAASAVGQVLRQIGHWMQGEFDQEQDMFTIEVVPSESGAGVIRLTPKRHAMTKYVQRIEILVDKAPDYRVTQVTIHESDVDRTELRFSHELHNPALPDKAFTAPEASAACQALFEKAADKEADPNKTGDASS